MPPKKLEEKEEKMDVEKIFNDIKTKHSAVLKQYNENKATSNKQFENIITELEALLKLIKGNKEHKTTCKKTHNLSGIAYFFSNEYTKAIEHFTASLSLAADYLPALSGLGRTQEAIGKQYLDKKNHAEALKSFQTAWENFNYADWTNLLAPDFASDFALSDDLTTTKRTHKPPEKSADTIRIEQEIKKLEKLMPPKKKEEQFKIQPPIQNSSSSTSAATDEQKDKQHIKHVSSSSSSSANPHQFLMPAPRPRSKSRSPEPQIIQEQKHRSHKHRHAAQEEQREYLDSEQPPLQQTQREEEPKRRKLFIETIGKQQEQPAPAAADPLTTMQKESKQKDDPLRSSLITPNSNSSSMPLAQANPKPKESSLQLSLHLDPEETSQPPQPCAPQLTVRLNSQ